MKKTWFFVVMAVVVMGCQNPAGPSSSADAIKGPGDLIRAMPEIKVALPSSLAAEGADPKPSVQNRALGDVTAVEKSSLPVAKAEAWQSSQIFVNPTAELRPFLDILRDAIPDDYESGTVIAVGEVNLANYVPSSSSGEIDMADMGRFVIEGDREEARAFWWFEMVDSVSGGSNAYFLDITVARLSVGYQITFHGEFFFDNEPTKYYIYVETDTASGESLTISNVYDGSVVAIATPNGDGSLTLLSKYEGMEGGIVGWGSDAEGGLLFLVGEGGQRYANIEYYDGDGDLISAAWGGSGADVFWVPRQEHAFNLATIGLGSPPEDLWIDSYWSEGDWHYRYSTNGSIFEDLPGYDRSSYWDLVYVADDVGWNWSTGDVEYVNTGWDETVGASHYTIGFEMPDAEVLLGKHVYLNRMRPLRRLLPIVGPYATWDLLSEELETYTSEWTDADGTLNVRSWTDFRFFLDNPSDGTLGALDSRDVELNDVEMTSTWGYSSSTGNYEKVRAPVARFFGELPPHYTNSDAPTMARLRAKLEGIYINELPSFSTDDYFDRVRDLSSDPIFDRLR